MKIKKEFKELIPPLKDDEYELLEKSILENGITDPIQLWNDYIIDGHNRYEIAQKHNLEFDTTELKFDNENDAEIYIIEKQMGRRNIEPFVRLELSEKYENRIKEKAKEKLIETNKTRFAINGKAKPTDNEIDKDFWGLNDEPEPETKPIDTRKEVAKIAGVSHGIKSQFDKIKDVIDEDTKHKLRTGETTIGNVFKKVKAKEKQIKLEKKKEENLSALKKDIVEKPLLYNESYKDFIKRYDDDSIDLLITDPPYSTDIDDIYSFSEEWINLVLPKIKPDGRAYICVGGYPKELQAYLNVLLKQNKFIVDNPLIWTYKNTLGQTPKMKYNLNYQVILHLYSESSRQLDTSVTSEMWSVQEINAPDGRQGDRFHTWQKPDELARRLITHSTKEGDLVVDVFACTGTFNLIASKLNRKSFGCDISADNLKIAKERGCDVK